MPESPFPYSEQILQWIWNEQLFDTSCLTTECGKSVQIISQGTLNLSDGPDFNHSKILIGNTAWNGSVELHLQSNGWYQHCHHIDTNYNNVILHVVVENNPSPIETASTSRPYTLNLLPYLDSNLESFLTGLQQTKRLPCADNVAFISNEVFEQQIDKAHLEYFEKKVEDFLGFYSPNKSQEMAWKHALIISIFDGFGISNNRVSMQELADKLLETEYASVQELKIHADRFAFSENINWNFKGCRPNSHPAKRIETAVHFLDLVLKTPFEDFLNKDAPGLWTSWCKEIGIQRAGHPKILFATVFLPSLYFLGTLYQSHSLIEATKEIWITYKAPIPKVLFSKFHELEIPASSYQKKLGAIHQLKHYCKAKKCSECFILKNAISS